MDLTANVTVRFTDGSSGALGDTAVVQVIASPESISGAPLIGMFLPETLESTVEFRLEQDSDHWSTDAGPISC
jgi:hypothetical protein